MEQTVASSATAGGRPGPGAWRHWALFGTVILGIVLIPYMLLGPSFEETVGELLRERTGRFVIAACGVLLLAADMLLPVPSSLVAPALGAALGWFWGTAAAATGLSVGCAIGLVLGRMARDGLAARQLGPDLQRATGLLQRYGPSVLVLCRGVPVLAEASVIAAGALGMPVWRCLTVTTLANVGVAFVYAAIGAAAWDISPVVTSTAFMLLAVALLIVISGARRVTPVSR